MSPGFLLNSRSARCDITNTPEPRSRTWLTPSPSQRARSPSREDHRRGRAGHGRLRLHGPVQVGPRPHPGRAQRGPTGGLNRPGFHRDFGVPRGTSESPSNPGRFNSTYVGAYVYAADRPTVLTDPSGECVFNDDPCPGHGLVEWFTDQVSCALSPARCHPLMTPLPKPFKKRSCHRSTPTYTTSCSIEGSWGVCRSSRLCPLPFKECRSEGFHL